MWNRDGKANSKVCIAAVYSLSRDQLFSDPMDCSLPGSSVHGIFQPRILDWVAISFFRGSSWSRNRAQVSWIAGEFFTSEPPGKSSRVHYRTTYCSGQQSFIPLQKHGGQGTPAASIIPSSESKEAGVFMHPLLLIIGWGLLKKST